MDEEWNAEIVGLIIECPRCGATTPVELSHLDSAVQDRHQAFFCWMCSIPIIAGWGATGIPWARLARKSDMKPNV